MCSSLQRLSSIAARCGLQQPCSRRSARFHRWRSLSLPSARETWPPILAKAQRLTFLGLDHSKETIELSSSGRYNLQSAFLTHPWHGPSIRRVVDQGGTFRQR
jgi:hypothetical protein